jgi:two-component system sensor kinase FixL
VGKLSVMTVLWSAVAAATLLLGFLYLLRWLADRRARVDLAFVITALGFAGIASTELWAMHAATPQEWGQAIRWCHPPIFLLTVGIVGFVHFHLGTGRAWLAWTTVGARAVILVWNFVAWPNFNFERVDSIASLPFLGEPVTVVAAAVTSRWQFLGTIASLLLAIYVLDASVRLWRTGGSEQRERAALIGGSMLLFVLVASAYAQLVIFGLLRVPILITPPFLLPLGAMCFEMSRDLLRVGRLTRELRDNQRRLEMAASAADLGLWEWDGRANRVWATRQARAIFDLADADQADYRDWLERVHPDDRARLRQELQRALYTGNECTMEFRILTGGAAPRIVLARGRSEPAGPEHPAQVRGVLRDITAQRGAQDETQELRRELAHSGRVWMLSQLTSSLAHEISQPLGAILRNAEAAGMMLDAAQPDHEELKAIVTDILRDDRRAREVIDRLRTMLKRQTAEHTPVPVDGLLQDVLALVRADAASRGIWIEHGASPNLPPVSGDRVALTQVLLNLVLNAMDAVADRPVDQRRVFLQAQTGKGGGVDLSVSDNGPGIPAGLERRIFDPFYTTKSSGMGLGLAISRGIAESHGGTLTCANNDQGGAAFRLLLPARREAPA